MIKHSGRDDWVVDLHDIRDHAGRAVVRACRSDSGVLNNIRQGIRGVDSRGVLVARITLEMQQMSRKGREDYYENI